MSKNICMTIVFLGFCHIVFGQVRMFPKEELFYPYEAQSLALGTAVYSLDNHIGNIFANPAATARITQNTLFLAYMPQWNSLKREAVAFVAPTLGATYGIGYSRISNTQSSEVITNFYPNYLTSYFFTMAFPSSKKFTVGFRVMAEDLVSDRKHEWQTALDIGFFWRPRKFISISSTGTNLIQQQKDGQNPARILHSGFSLYLDQLVTTSFVHHYNIDSMTSSLGFGISFSPISFGSIQLGSYDSRILMGLSLKLFDLEFNYSYLNSQDHPSHFLSFIHRFGTPLPQKREARKLMNLANLAMARGEGAQAIGLIDEAFRLDSLNADIANQFHRIKRIGDELERFTKEIQDSTRAVMTEDMQMDRAPAFNLGRPLNTPFNEASPALTADGRTMFFTSTRPGSITNDWGPTEDFWMATLKDSVWTEPVNLGPTINTDRNEGVCSISSDGQTIFFSKTNESENSGLDIYSSKLDGLVWGPPQNLGTAVNSPYWDAHPSISNDRKSLYFSSNRPGGQGQRDLYVSHMENGVWTKAQNLGPEINSPYDEAYPFIFFDNKTLYFASNRPGGFGGYDLYMSRLRPDGSWTKPANMGPLFNSSNDDISFSVDPSGRWAYISSTRTGSEGMLDIYKIQIPEPLRPPMVIPVIAKVLDSKTGAPIQGGFLSVIDAETGELLYELQVNSVTGETKLALEPGRRYKLLLSGGENYISRESLLDLTHKTAFETVDSKYELYPVLKKIIIKGKITDRYTQEPLLAQIRVEVLETGEEIANFFTTSLTGEYRVEVPNDRNYNISVSADNYFFESAIIRPSEYEGEKEITKDFQLTIVRVGEKVRIQNILFDIDKATLRPEAYVELNRAVELLKRYPQIGIQIEGHTDNTGSEEHNLRLSEERCLAVKNYLVEQGIDENRILTVGFGESQPIADNSTPEGRQLNRRTEFKIIEARSESQEKQEY